MKKNCPGKKSLYSFSDQLYENKTDPFAQANNARACSDCLKQRSRILSKCLCGVMLAPYHRKGDRSRRGTLLAERKCMKRWCSGWLKKEINPYTPDNVSTYKRGLKCLLIIGIVTGPDLNIDFPSLYQEKRPERLNHWGNPLSMYQVYQKRCLFIEVVQ